MTILIELQGIFVVASVPLAETTLFSRFTDVVSLKSLTKQILCFFSETCVYHELTVILLKKLTVILLKNRNP